MLKRVEQTCRPQRKRGRKKGQFFILDSDRELYYKNMHGETFKSTIPQCSLSCDESR
jgi:hypothetical protein